MQLRETLFGIETKLAVNLMPSNTENSINTYKQQKKPVREIQIFQRAFFNSPSPKLHPKISLSQPLQYLHCVFRVNKKASQQSQYQQQYAISYSSNKASISSSVGFIFLTFPFSEMFNSI